MLREIKALGVSIAIDDFGTGYSTLSYLKRMPIDILKIDRAFDTECDQGGEELANPRAIVSLARNLNMRVVAEGIERSSQMVILLAHGCDEFQGYMIARPLTPEGVGIFLERDGACG